MIGASKWSISYIMEETGSNWNTVLSNIVNAYRARLGYDAVSSSTMMFGVPPHSFSLYMKVKFNHYLNWTEDCADEDDQEATNRRAKLMLVVKAQRLPSVVPITPATQRVLDVKDRFYVLIPRSCKSIPLQP